MAWVRSSTRSSYWAIPDVRWSWMVRDPKMAAKGSAAKRADAEGPAEGPGPYGTDP